MGRPKAVCSVVDTKCTLYCKRFYRFVRNGGNINNYLFPFERVNDDKFHIIEESSLHFFP